MKKSIFSIITICALCVLVLTSCQKEENLQNAHSQVSMGKSQYPEAIAAEDLPSPATAPYIEPASFTNDHGTEQTGWLDGQEIRFRSANDSLAIISGDILVHKSAIKTDKNAIETRAATYQYGRSWTNKIVYYQIDAQFPSVLRNSFLTACNEWNRLTGIRFVQRTSTAQVNYIYVFKGNGDYSMLGMIGGKQNLSLNDTNQGVAIHELGHALGMVHEHQRSDRDVALLVNPAADPSNVINRFQSYNYGAFDWSSIMLYRSKPLGNGTYDMVRRSDRRAFPNTIESARAVGRYALPSVSDVNLMRSIYR